MQYIVLGLVGFIITPGPPTPGCFVRLMRVLSRESKVGHSRTGSGVELSRNARYCINSFAPSVSMVESARRCKPTRGQAILMKRVFDGERIHYTEHTLPSPINSY